MFTLHSYCFMKIRVMVLRLVVFLFEVSRADDWGHIQFIMTVPWLEISIDGCRIWPIARKIRQKSPEEVLGLKIDGCMHPLPRIDGCSCTRRTRTNQGPVLVQIPSPQSASYCPRMSRVVPAIPTQLYFSIINILSISITKQVFVVKIRIFLDNLQEEAIF